MKRLLAVLLVVMLLYSCNGKNKIVGEWSAKGTYEANEMLIFKDDGTFLSVKGENGETSFGFKVGKAKFELNTSKSPNTIDYVFFDSDGKEEVVRLRGIVEFLGQNVARLGFNTNKRDLIEMMSRPKNFNDCDIKMISRK